MSRYELARRTGVSEANLSRFVNRKTGMNSDNIDRICGLLGLELRPTRRPRRTKGSKR
jgi:DNA-binding Xre family transcriptional regulator